MHIRRLRLVGFKSFVEPTELMIEPGLTGLVGPNGCGKSNLLEALRWVMGEQSHKSMRAAAMDDVIFAGTGTRPQRGFAEVTISIDNSDRKAPAEFNDLDDIEITRRIEREQGSSYRINGLDARARDVKLLFEDAATGARSPALVRQGQVSELVNAKPEHRRRILEDAAGIAGLHSRRHEAELRLKASEVNIARVADVMGGLDSQIASLKRQSRQAKRYKELSGLIRQAEALQQHLGWLQTTVDVDAAEALQIEALAALGIAALAETEAMNRELAAAEALPPLRDAEVTRAAVLQRLSVERQLLADEEARARDRLADLNQRLVEARRDEAREAGLAEESREAAARMTTEREAFGDDPEQEPAGLLEARSGAERARAAESAAEAELATMIGEISELNARRKQLKHSLEDTNRELATLDLLVSDGNAMLVGLASHDGEATRTLTASVEGLATEIADQQDLVVEQEQILADKRHEHAEALREAAAERLAAERLAAEAATLQRLFRSDEAQGPAPVADKLKIERGYERAVAAALGDDLDVPLDATAPHHWREIAATGSDPELPSGSDALSRHVKGPAAVRRRLQQIGVVDDTAGDALQAILSPGQRLVSRNGGLWRWDGIVVRAGAPTAYALRLEQRNRLEMLEGETAEANQRADAKEQVLQHLRAEIDHVAAIEKGLKARLAATRAALDRDRTALAAVERRSRDDALRRAGVEEAQRQRQAAREALIARRDAAAAELTRIADTQPVETNFETASATFARLRRERSLAEVADRIAAARALVAAPAL